VPLPAHLSALILFVALATAAEPQGVALTNSGATATGAIQVASGRLTVDDVQGDQLLGIRLPGAVAQWIDQGLVLGDGDVLRGTPLLVGKDGLGFASDLLGPITVPYAQVAALLLSPTRIGEAAPAGFVGAVLANGDRLGGRLASLDATTVGIDTGKKTINVPRTRVAQVVLRAPAIAADAARRLVVRFANGDRLGGTLTAPTAGRWELTSPHGAVRFTAADARGLWFEGADRRPLATLVATSGGAAGTDAASDGGWLSVGGQRWDRGLLCRAPSRLEYDVPAGSTALTGEVALTPGAGSAVFRVLVDGQPAFDSGPVLAGAAAKPFSVPLVGRAKLALVVDPGADSAGLGARAVWGWAIVVR